MKDFDEFHSWIEFEKRYLDGHKKQLFFLIKTIRGLKIRKYYLVSFSSTIPIIISV